MKHASQIAWDDTVLPFQLESTDARGRIARLDGVLDGVLKQHKYPPVVQALVAEMTMLTALIGESIKLRWKLSLQVQSKGALRMIATDYFGPSKEGEPAQIRAYASYDEERLDHDVAMNNIGDGYFAVLIDQGDGMKPYQGITGLVSTSLSDAASGYFAQSEQLPTRFVLYHGLSQTDEAAPSWRGGGVMLQQMPPAGEHVPSDGPTGPEGHLAPEDLLGGDALENWSRANFHLDTVEELELIGPSLPPQDLLYRLFHEEGVRVFDAQAVRFGCTCSEGRVRQSLSIYSQKDISKMTTDEGRVTADCQFCGASYDLDPTTVGFDAPNEPNAE